MDSDRAPSSVPQDIPTGRPETPPTDCTYPTSWYTESGCSDSGSLFDSDKENCPPQLESEVEPRSTRPSSRISTDSNDSGAWSIPPPSSKGIKGKGRTFHDKRGISYTEFKTFYADTRNANALRKQIYEEGTRWSTALLGILQGFQAVVPNDEEYLRVIRAFEHADREMSFMQERFAAYATDVSSIETDISRTILANASRTAEGVANLLRIEKEFASSLFRQRQLGAKALLDVAKGYGLDASGRKVMGARPGSASYSSTICQECGKTGHPTIDCFDYACPKCLNIRPRHFVDTCPFKIKRDGIICQHANCRNIGHHALDCPINICRRCKQTFRKCATWCEPKLSAWQLADQRLLGQSGIEIRQHSEGSLGEFDIGTLRTMVDLLLLPSKTLGRARSEGRTTGGHGQTR
jgi:hypothetical protein